MRSFNKSDKALIKDIHAYIGLALTMYTEDRGGDWTYEGLAQDSGLSVSTVANLTAIPHPTYVPSSLTLAKVAKATGLMLVLTAPDKATLKVVGKYKQRKAS